METNKETVELKDVLQGKSTGKKVVDFTANEPIEINGDKVIAFINAVKKLGDILEMINVIEIKDAFIMGKQCESVERVIALRKQWIEVFAEIQSAWSKDLDVFKACLASSKDMKILLTSISHVGQTKEYKDSLQSLKELADVLDRLEKHKQSGLLEAVSKI